ncbi:MAG: glycosyltransferase family 4 protein [Acidobacteria bacterium]|nr:glycosyltransferase family 4 protein [Acidobacteriota bacterium]
MKIAVVVQRYGADISGGAELHARFIAERLSSRLDVRVLTTCARDHTTWRDEFPAGLDDVNGVPVERFSVSRQRDRRDFDVRSRRVFLRLHTLQEELDWLDSEGPVSPTLLSRLRRSREEFDFVLLFCVRYYLAYYGARSIPGRAVLVPTAEREPALGLALFQPIFRGVRAIMYNSFEERATIHAVSNNEHVPGVVVGVSSNIPTGVDPARARTKFGLSRPFLVYVGRIEAAKGCAELFDFFDRFTRVSDRPLDLVLIGTAVLPIPAHPRIRHLGFVDDQDKFDVIAAAEALVMPSYYESLSMVALEAWALGRPVLANGRCDVLRGQCIRSNAGLYYDNISDFMAAIDRLLGDPPLAAALGHNGRDFFARDYSWPVIERKYLDMFDRLASERAPHRMEPLPGWFARRRPVVPAAADVLAGLPEGPSLQFQNPAEVSA